MDLDYRPIAEDIRQQLIVHRLMGTGYTEQEAQELFEKNFSQEKPQSIQTPPTKDKGKTIPSCEIQPTTNWALVLLWVLFVIGSFFLIWHFWG